MFKEINPLPNKFIKKWQKTTWFNSKLDFGVGNKFSGIGNYPNRIFITP